MADYDALAGLGEGFKQFAQSWGDAEDRKLKRMALEAEMNAKDETRQRQAFQDALELRKSGFQIPENYSGDIRQVDPRTLKYDPEFVQMRTAQSQAFQDPYGLKNLQVQKLTQEIQERQKAKTPQGKIEGLSGEQRGRFDNVVGVIDALSDIEAAYGAIDPSTAKGKTEMLDVPLRGDTSFTSARNRFVEFLGRMQSGGQISKEEFKSFRNLLPGPFDSPDIAQSKLGELKRRMESRLQTFGVDRGSAESLGYLKPGLLQKSPQGLIAPDEVKKTTGKIVRISNGEETFEIDLSTAKGKTDLADAMKDGFREVK